MARSNSKSSLLDRAALAGIALGLLAYVTPIFGEGRLKFAFWLTLFATLLHIYTSHSSAAADDDGGGP